MRAQSRKCRASRAGKCRAHSVAMTAKLKKDWTVSTVEDRTMARYDDIEIQYDVKWGLFVSFRAQRQRNSHCEVKAEYRGTVMTINYAIAQPGDLTNLLDRLRKLPRLQVNEVHQALNLLRDAWVVDGIEQQLTGK